MASGPKRTAGTVGTMSTAIAGVRIRRLEPHRDHRGVFVEVYRDTWYEGLRPIQWNAVFSEANTLRGFHCHVRHVDVFTVATSGQACRLEFVVANATVNGGHAAAEMGRELPQAIAMLDVSAVDPGPVGTARDDVRQRRTPRTH